MSTFVSWPSIENSYQQKNIDWWLERYPELKNETYVILEKLHGSNFQWFIQPNQPVMAGSRNQFLDVNGSFNGVSIPELMAKESAILKELQFYADNNQKTYRLFGELFGGNIQKGIKYGDEKRLLYFGIMVDDVLQSFDDLNFYISPENIVPVIKIVKGLENVLKFNPEFDSTILGVEDNICEGVVVMPYNKVYQEQSVFMLKIKNEAFKEKSREPKIQVIDSEIQRLNLEFKCFVNNNRLQSIFSKHGQIESKSQIGDYLKYLVEDAKEDFLNEFDISHLDSRQVFNIGSLGFNLLKEYL